MTATASRMDRLTLEAWAAMDEDEPGELVDGVLVEEEVARNLHEVVVSWAFGTLRAWAKPRGGRVLGSEHKIGISADRGRKPDVSYYPADSPLRDAPLSRTPPFVIVEVVSPTPRDAHRDRVDKLAEYAAFGVPYYWLIDPRVRIVEVLRLGADRCYTIVLSVSSGVHPAPGCEGLVLDVDDLWRDLDTLLPNGEGEAEAKR